MLANAPTVLGEPEAEVFLTHITLLYTPTLPTDSKQHFHCNSSVVSLSLSACTESHGTTTSPLTSSRALQLDSIAIRIHEPLQHPQDASTAESCILL